MICALVFRKLVVCLRERNRHFKELCKRGVLRQLREEASTSSGSRSALGEGLCMLMLQAVLACSQSPGIRGSSLASAHHAVRLEGRVCLTVSGGWEAASSQDCTEHLGFYPECMCILTVLFVCWFGFLC